MIQEVCRCTRPRFAQRDNGDAALSRPDDLLLDSLQSPEIKHYPVFPRLPHHAIPQLPLPRLSGSHLRVDGVQDFPLLAAPHRSDQQEGRTVPSQPVDDHLIGFPRQPVDDERASTNPRSRKANSDSRNVLVSMCYFPCTIVQNADFAKRSMKRRRSS